MTKKTNKTNKNTKKIDVSNYTCSIASLDTNALDSIKIDKAELLEPVKDSICKIVITDYDKQFIDNLNTIEYQLDEHSERKTIELYKTIFYGYLLNSDNSVISKDRYIIDISTKRPNFAKSLLALKLTQEHYNIQGKLYPVITCLVNYIHYDTNTINSYMLNAIED